uniref:Uncharacterized protein n=1 Tax=Romanomermis culicivorax TaxID=13658 RepID=A0A915KCR2_ROMCU
MLLAVILRGEARIVVDCWFKLLWSSKDMLFTTARTLCNFASVKTSALFKFIKSGSSSIFFTTSSSLAPIMAGEIKWPKQPPQLRIVAKKSAFPVAQLAQLDRACRR